jgi:hypothetical protein
MSEVFLVVHDEPLKALYQELLFMTVRDGPVKSGPVVSIVAYIRCRRLGCNRVH